MRTRIVLGVLVSLAVAPAAAMGAALPKFPSHLIVPGQSVGGVSIGETAAKAIRAWGGNAQCVLGPTLTECVWGSEANGTTGSITLSFAKQKVDLIAVQLNANTKGMPVYRGALMRLKTKKGIGLRSTDADLEKAYPGHVGTGAIGPTLGSGAHTTSFSTSSGRFVTIDVGTAPSV